MRLFEDGTNGFGASQSALLLVTALRAFQADLAVQRHRLRQRPRAAAAPVVEQGLVPMQAFVDAMPIAKEKVIAA